MKSRKILGQSGAIALMFALIFTPLALATDEVPQSGPGDADSPGLNSNTDESAVTEPLEHVDLADQATEGEEEAVPSFDATYRTISWADGWDTARVGLATRQR